MSPPTVVSPPASPPISPPPASPSSGTVRPVLFIEKDADGATFLRVEEDVYNAFATTAPQRTVVDRVLGPSSNTNFIIDGAQTTKVQNVDISQMKHGLMLKGTGLVSIYDYTYTKYAGVIYGAAIKLVDPQPAGAATYIERVVGDGMQQPDASYQISNTDFIGIETEIGPVYVRDVTGKNFGDAAVDSKSTKVYIMNATFSNAHRMLRAWQGVEIIIVNSIVNAAPGHDQGHVLDGTSTIRYYNTLWCEGAENPSAADPKCKTTPWMTGGEDMTLEQAGQRFIPLQSNPLPGINPFFKTSIDQIAVEYSSDAGKTWQALSLPNTGSPGSAPIGDPRYKIPLNLAAADYRFRATYMKNGVKTGEMSQPVDETGNASS